MTYATPDLRLVGTALQLVLGGANPIRPDHPDPNDVPPERTEFDED